MWRLVRLQVNVDTSAITLNTLDLDLEEVHLRSEGSDVSQSASSKEYEPVHQRTTFTFPKTLPAHSKARLTITFSAEITGHMMGYYKSIGGQDGKTVYALTQFQVSPTIIHRMFLC